MSTGADRLRRALAERDRSVQLRDQSGMLPRQGILETMLGTLGMGVGLGAGPEALSFLGAAVDRAQGGPPLDPYQHTPVGTGRFSYPPGRLPGRDLPRVEPSSAVRIVEENPGVGAEVVKHGTWKQYETPDPRTGTGVIGPGHHVTNEGRYASAFARFDLDAVGDDTAARPQIRLNRLREGRLYDTNAPEDVMKRQIEDVAKAFASREVLKADDPGRWAKFYHDARRVLETPEGRLAGGTGVGQPMAIERLALESLLSQPRPLLPGKLAQQRNLRFKNLLRHAGYSGVKAKNDFHGGWQATVFSPAKQLVHPYRPVPPERRSGR